MPQKAAGRPTTGAEPPRIAACQRIVSAGESAETPVNSPYRDLPSVDRLLADERVAPLRERHGHEAVVQLAREILEEYRASIEQSGSAPPVAVVDVLLTRAEQLRPSLRRVVNATGVIIHTNLGRAPLSRATIEAMQRVSVSYSNLEFDLEGGRRGSRFSHLESLLCRITGAEAGIAVNNNASALLLALGALCAGREVIISRGQLVEIGGGFRIPDVLRQSGATLVEVGTTNRTYTRDYAAAMTDQTAAILRVHASNFRVIGFTEQPSLSELAALARARGALLLDDLGSGALLDAARFGLHGEPIVQDSVRAGADIVLFSGDKLLGGPQAGIAAGRRGPIEEMRRHPLSRALRMDKASIAGLAATLEHYARGEAETEVPVWRMIAETGEAIGRRARRWSRACGAFGLASEARSTVGGGSLPGEELDSVVCSVDPPGGDADAFAASLRAANPPIVARIQDGRVLLDPRTVDPREDMHVEATLRALCGAGAAGTGLAGGE
ncbi:MAG: L-seryl-tRNA(Sec) selenium transferase [Dehalococcoidia bacterium]|nr:L-seryl-tRNA(Sec) selenium transferase [Dehalococcoidia bacterium]